MATLSKQVLLTGEINDTGKTAIVKTTSFCLSVQNQLAARLGGAASLVEAQTKQSHGEILASTIADKVAAVKAACKETQEVVGLAKVTCRQMATGNSAVNSSISTVDPKVSDAAHNALAEALREAQSATLGVSSVTEPGSPSPMSAKVDMLATQYLAAKKQTLAAKIDRPYLLLLNQKLIH